MQLCTCLAVWLMVRECSSVSFSLRLVLHLSGSGLFAVEWTHLLTHLLIGSMAEDVLQGRQVWRLIVAPFLSAGTIDALLGSLALLLVGTRAVRHLGYRGFVVMLVLGAVVSSSWSAALPVTRDRVFVGNCGMITCLLAATAVTEAWPPIRHRLRLRAMAQRATHPVVTPQHHDRRSLSSRVAHGISVPPLVRASCAVATLPWMMSVVLLLVVSWAPPMNGPAITGGAIAGMAGGLVASDHASCGVRATVVGLVLVCVAVPGIALAIAIDR